MRRGANFKIFSSLSTFNWRSKKPSYVNQKRTRKKNNQCLVSAKFSIKISHIKTFPPSGARNDTEKVLFNGLINCIFFKLFVFLTLNTLTENSILDNLEHLAWIFFSVSLEIIFF